VRLTHIGGPTALIELDGWTILTDPTFDPAGGHYEFGWGTASDKVAGPAIAAGELPPIDVVLLSHDHHEDNLDAAGRALLPKAGTVITTASGAQRLGGSAHGLVAWQGTRLEGPGTSPVEVIATPCRHGPPLSHPIVGDVIGFTLIHEGRVIWISGDTVVYPGVKAMAGRWAIDVALLHLGGVQFPLTGPLRYTLTAQGAIELVELLEPKVVVPIHYEGWSHFKQGREAIEADLATAPQGVRDRFRWVPIGEPVEL
jgi:L-ascorbate metabolism protein UlaG (beta-lactamase superfamily)